jgi:hypothetical protein
MPDAYLMPITPPSEVIELLKEEFKEEAKREAKEQEK